MSVPGKNPDLDRLAREVEEWGPNKRPQGNWRDAPDAIPRIGETQAISIRLPIKLIEILKMFAAREGVGYQALMKRWLDDRLRDEQKALQRTIPITGTSVLRFAASFPIPKEIDHISGKADAIA